MLTNHPIIWDFAIILPPSSLIYNHYHLPSPLLEISIFFNPLLRLRPCKEKIEIPTSTQPAAPRPVPSFYPLAQGAPGPQTPNPATSIPSEITRESTRACSTKVTRPAQANY
jgi:hypothetical protein